MEEETTLGRTVLVLVNVPTKMFDTVFDLSNLLSGKKGQETWKNFKHLLRREFEIKFPLIHWVDTVLISYTTEKFVAKDKFRRDSKEVKFCRISDTFTNRFLVGDGKIEEPLDEQELRYGNLIKGSVDSLIKEELGGEAKAETTLKELYHLLTWQPNGEEGDLLTNTNTNVFYIRDMGGVLCTVVVYWRRGGWHVFVNSFEYPRDCYAGDRVFSRNS